MNTVCLVGNLTRDIELRYTQSGTAVCGFGLAVNERTKKGEEWVDDPVFVDCTAFGRSAEVLSEYCSKGTKIGLEGKLRLERWESDGQKRSKLSVVANRIELLGARNPSATDPEAHHEPQEAAVGAGASDEEDIPF